MWVNTDEVVSWPDGVDPYGKVLSVGEKPRKGHREVGPEVTFQRCDVSGQCDGPRDEENTDTVKASSLKPHSPGEDHTSSDEDAGGITNTASLSPPTFTASQDTYEPISPRHEFARQLVDMGYSSEAAYAAVEATHAVNVAAAVEHLLNKKSLSTDAASADGSTPPAGLADARVQAAATGNMATPMLAISHPLADEEAASQDLSCSDDSDDSDNSDDTDDDVQAAVS